MKIFFLKYFFHFYSTTMSKKSKINKKKSPNDEESKLEIDLNEIPGNIYAEIKINFQINFSRTIYIYSRIIPQNEMGGCS